MKYKAELRETETSAPHVMKLDFAISVYSAKMAYNQYRKKLETQGSPSPFRFVTIYEDDRLAALRDFQTQNKWINYGE